MLCDDLEGWDDGGSKVKREGIYVYKKKKKKKYISEKKQWTHDNIVNQLYL